MQVYMPTRNMLGFWIPPPLVAKRYTINATDYIECECVLSSSGPQQGRAHALEHLRRASMD